MKQQYQGRRWICNSVVVETDSQDTRQDHGSGDGGRDHVVCTHDRQNDNWRTCGDADRVGKISRSILQCIFHHSVYISQRKRKEAETNYTGHNHSTEEAATVNTEIWLCGDGRWFQLSTTKKRTRMHRAVVHGAWPRGQIKMVTTMISSVCYGSTTCVQSIPIPTSSQRRSDGDGRGTTVDTMWRTFQRGSKSDRRNWTICVCLTDGSRWSWTVKSAGDQRSIVSTNSLTMVFRSPSDAGGQRGRRRRKDRTSRSWRTSHDPHLTRIYELNCNAQHNELRAHEANHV